MKVCVTFNNNNSLLESGWSSVLLPGELIFREAVKQECNDKEQIKKRATAFI